MARRTANQWPQNELLFNGNARIRLIGTDDDGKALPDAFGRVSYPAVQLGDFNTTIVFEITRLSTIAPGQGLVFFIVPEGHQFPQNPIGSDLGIFNSTGPSPGVFAVEFNILPRQGTDQVDKRLGIDIQSKEPVACSEDIPGAVVGREVTLSINYVADPGIITARVKVGELEPAPPVTYNYNLSNILPPRVQFGLAASTGDFAAVFDVISWSGI